MANEKSKIKETVDGVGGLIILGVLGWAAWNFWLFPDGGDAPVPDAETAAQEVAKQQDLDLAEYRDMDEDARAALVAAHMVEAGVSTDQQKAFVTCVGDYAPQKSGAVKLADVFGWCLAEYEREAPEFQEHYNELDAPDLMGMASAICQTHVKNRLKSPGTADFPWLPDTVVRQPRQKYRITSYVDAQNSLGATVRLYYTCDIQYDLAGDEHDNRAWDVMGLEVVQR